MSKDKILGDIRRGLGRSSALDDTISSALVQRMHSADDTNAVSDVAGSSNDVPTQALKLFCQQLESAGATFDEVDRLDDVAMAIHTFREMHSLTGTIVLNDDDIVRRLPVPDSLQVSRRAVGDADELSITGAVCAVAETGSIVVKSGNNNATRSSFLPDNHIVVLRRSQLVEQLEDVWSETLDETQRMPRSVNLITGPSKTADVEQTLQFGAHGPCRLHVIVVDDDVTH